MGNNKSVNKCTIIIGTTPESSIHIECFPKTSYSLHRSILHSIPNENTYHDVACFSVEEYDKCIVDIDIISKLKSFGNDSLLFNSFNCSTFALSWLGLNELCIR